MACGNCLPLLSLLARVKVAAHQSVDVGFRKHLEHIRIRNATMDSSRGVSVDGSIFMPNGEATVSNSGVSGISFIFGAFSGSRYPTPGIHKQEGAFACWKQ